MRAASSPTQGLGGRVNPIFGQAPQSVQRDFSQLVTMASSTRNVGDLVKVGFRSSNRAFVQARQAFFSAPRNKTHTLSSAEPTVVAGSQPPPPEGVLVRVGTITRHNLGRSNRPVVDLPFTTMRQGVTPGNGQTRNGVSVSRSHCRRADV